MGKGRVTLAMGFGEVCGV